MRTRFLTLLAAAGLGAALAQSASAADLSMPPIYRGPPPRLLHLDRLVCRSQRRRRLGPDQSHCDCQRRRPAARTTNNFNTSGWLGGGTIGYNYQMGQWLVGAEADLDWSNIRGTFNGTVPVPGRRRGVLAELAAQLARHHPRACRLGVGPCAVLRHRRRRRRRRDRHGDCICGRGRPRRRRTAADTQTRFGWTAGAGVEYAFNNYLSAKVEYLYVDLGTQTQINVDNVKFNTNIVRAGVNLHF